MHMLANAAELADYQKTGELFYQDVARKIEIASGSRDTAQDYVNQIRNYVLSDRVAFFFEINARQENATVLLTGAVERPEFKAIVTGVLNRLGFASIHDEVEVVPNLEKHAEPFGLVVAPYILTSSNPDKMAVPMDEALFGEPVYILQELPAVLLVKTFSGYWGYAPKTAIRLVGREEFVQHINGEAVIFKRDFHDGKTVIPMGSRMVVRKWGSGKECLLLNPQGKTLRVPKAICRRNDRAKELKRVIASAQAYLDSPYNRGGKNQHAGIDCSGLIQLSYRAIGLNLPRDAKQQYLGGNLIPPYLTEALLPGDALFFMNGAGQVNHVALYLGNRQIIHATGDRVKINSLDPSAKNYLVRFARDYIGAKRFWW